MRFDRNIYLRLEQIAFFIPDLRRSEGNTITYQFTIPIKDSIPVDDPILKEKIYNMFFTALHREYIANYTSLQNFMRIDDLEYAFFVVCVSVYERLSDLFSPRKEKFLSSKKTKKYDLQDHYVDFYKSIPQNIITKDIIKDKSYGMFQSVKMACEFYCKFHPSYCLYCHSKNIKMFEHEIPMLVRTKEIVSTFLCSFPLKPFKELERDLSYLSDLLYIHSEAKEKVVSAELQKDTYWRSYKKTIDNEIIYNCIDIAENLPRNTLIPIFKLMLEEKPELVSEVEKKRRKKSSEARKKRLEEREAKVQEHVKRILRRCRSENISIKEACNDYFKEKKIELSDCGINSIGTLRNRCSHTKPNKQRSAFFNRSYIKPDYPKDLRKNVVEIMKKIKESGL